MNRAAAGLVLATILANPAGPLAAGSPGRPSAAVIVVSAPGPPAPRAERPSLAAPIGARAGGACRGRGGVIYPHGSLVDVCLTNDGPCPLSVVAPSYRCNNGLWECADNGYVKCTRSGWRGPKAY